MPKPRTPSELNRLHASHYGTRDQERGEMPREEQEDLARRHIQSALAGDEEAVPEEMLGPRQYRLVARLSKDRFRIVDAKGHFHIYDSQPDEEERYRKIMNDSRYPMPQRIAALRRMQDRANGRRSW